MEFAQLLQMVAIAPADVAVCLHKPGDIRTRRILATWAAERRDLFDAYQSTHPPIAEATLKRRSVLAAFVAREDATLLFCGLWDVRGWVWATIAELQGDPIHAEMRAALGHADFVAKWASRGVEGRARFDLAPRAELADLDGRLAVADPGGRAHMRRAETTPLRVVEIAARPAHVPPMPDWRRLTLTTAELRALPKEWALKLSEWRGIYLIIDEADGARYVGAAYGAENLLGRWRAHVAGEAGVTKELARRQTSRFRFAILERVGPDATVEDVTAAEQGWIERLDTRRFGLNT
jgi:hypothetical protein